MHFDHGKNKIQIFNLWTLGLICREFEVTVGSENQLNFLRAYLFRRGKVEHVLTMANLKLRPSLYTPALPNILTNARFRIGCRPQVLPKLVQLSQQHPVILQEGNDIKISLNNIENIFIFKNVK